MLNSMNYNSLDAVPKQAVANSLSGLSYLSK